jgi:hypothetical protein
MLSINITIHRRTVPKTPQMIKFLRSFNFLLFETPSSLLYNFKTIMGTINNENVAENFINGPSQAEGSKGKSPNAPIPKLNNPASTPNIKKHVIHTRDIGSNIAICQPGILAKIGVRNADMISDKAPKTAAPAIFNVRWADFDIFDAFSSDLFSNEFPLFSTDLDSKVILFICFFLLRVIL